MFQHIPSPRPFYYLGASVTLLLFSYFPNYLLIVFLSILLRLSLLVPPPPLERETDVYLSIDVVAKAAINYLRASIPHPFELHNKQIFFKTAALPNPLHRIQSEHFFQPDVE